MRVLQRRETNRGLDVLKTKITAAREVGAGGDGSPVGASCRIKGRRGGAEVGGVQLQRNAEGLLEGLEGQGVVVRACEQKISVQMRT